MSLVTNLLDFVEVAAAELKAQRNRTGDLSALSTTTKTNLVTAVNELNAAVANASGIDDNSTGTASSWSSSRTAQEITDAATAVKNDVLGGAGAAYDTLGELQALLADSGDAIAALNTALGSRVSVDAAQSFTAGQQVQARANVGAASAAEVGDTSTDFVAAFNAAMV